MSLEELENGAWNKKEMLFSEWSWKHSYSKIPSFQTGVMLLWGI